MTDLTDTRTLAKGVTVVGVFRDGAAARAAARTLEKTGFPPDRVGIVDDNVRNAREVAGSYSPQGAIVGALLGALLVAVIVIFGGEAVRANPASVALGAVVVLIAFTAIGWLAGRARLFKQGEYEDFENAVDVGDALISVVCETEDGADKARVLLKQAGAIAVRREESTEAV